MIYNGRKSGHVLGFVRTIISFLKQHPTIPTSVVYALDGYPERKYRSYTEYKGGREDSRRDGDPMPDITRVVSILPGYVLYHPDEEADDVISAFLYWFRKREDREKRHTRATIQVMTSDRDLLSLVDPVTLWTPSTNKDGWVRTPSEVGSHLHVHFPVLPVNVPLFKAVTGDTSDHIPGIPRIRKEALARAMWWVIDKDASKSFSGCDGSVQSLIQAIAREPNSLSKSERAKISQGMAAIKRNHALIQLSRIRIWPKRNHHAQSVLRDILLKHYGCYSLAEDITRFPATR